MLSKVKTAIEKPELVYHYFRDPLYLKYLQFTASDGVIERDVQGSKMELDLSDKGISRDLALHGIREPITTRRFQEELREIDSESEGKTVVLEIGANIGYYALMEASILGEGAEIYAVEADPGNISKLEKNIRLNDYDGIIDVDHVAIGAEEGEADLHISSRSNLHTMQDSAVGTDWHEISSSKTVPVRTADAYMEEKGVDAESVNVLRMDVEGYEAEVFRGMSNIIEFASPLLLQIEIHPHLMGEEDTAYLTNILSELDFEIVSAATHTYEYDIESFEEVGDFRWVEIIAKRAQM